MTLKIISFHIRLHYLGLKQGKPSHQLLWSPAVQTNNAMLI